MLAEERRVVVKVRIDADSGEPSVISTVVLVYLGRMRFCRNVRPIIVRKGTYIMSLSLALSLCLLSLCLYLSFFLLGLTLCLSLSLPPSLPPSLPSSLPPPLPLSPCLSFSLPL